MGGQRNLLGGLFAFGVLVAAWQLIAVAEPSYVFPSLLQVFKDIGNFAESGLLWTATLTTLKSVAIGGGASLIVGVMAGFALHRYGAFFGVILNFAQTIPYVVWALMSMIWFGLSPLSVIFTIFVAGFTVIAFNVAEGLRQVDGQLVEMADSVRANRYMRFRHITLPSLAPYLLSGARTMAAVCWKIVVLAELFAGGGSSGGGIGYNLYAGWEFNRTNEVFAWTVWLVVLMMLTDWLIIAPITRLANRWKRA